MPVDLSASSGWNLATAGCNFSPISCFCGPGNGVDGARALLLAATGTGVAPVKETGGEVPIVALSLLRLWHVWQTHFSRGTRFLYKKALRGEDKGSSHAKQRMALLPSVDTVPGPGWAGCVPVLVSSAAPATMATSLTATMKEG